MMSLEDAQAMVARSVQRLATATVVCSEANGLVLAADVVAGEPVPPFANTAMDGYAVIAADTTGATTSAPVRLRVVGELPAGSAPDRSVAPGESIRIMTGAPMPAGADAVVMVELTERDDPAGEVAIGAPAQAGDHVRLAGGDVDRGVVVFTAGTVIRAAHIGVLASLDIGEIEVVQRARVGVLSTGDEIVERGALAPGKIRDSNRPMLLSLVAEAGCIPVDLGIARDNEAEIFEVIGEATRSCDALLTSGAVSVGDYDFVKVAIERLAAQRGGEYRWQQVAIKPAKPLAYATINDGARTVPVFGLPGNPVSSHVSFELFARPVLRSMMGHRETAARPLVNCIANVALSRRADGKVHLDRVRVWIDRGELRCERSGVQASNALSAMANAQGLAILADGVGVAAGEPVAVLLLTDLLGDI